jgi:hypothetical protein
MALIPISTLSVAGTGPSFLAAAAGDTAQIDPRLWLEVRNGAGASMTVTVAAFRQMEYGGALPDKVYTVPAGGEVRIPLLATYASNVDGLAHITYSSTTTVTRAVVRV